MSRVPLIMDVDPGVDDMAALLLAMASREIALLGITTVAGNVPLAAATGNALKTVALAGREDVPVHAGSSGPLLRSRISGRHAELGLFADVLVPPTPLRPRPGHAARFIAETARRAAREGAPITVCASGPLTNLALALVQDAEVRRGIRRILVMGGAFVALGNRAPWAEFNMLADPHAAHVVLTSGVPLTMFPLDATFQALVTERHLERLRQECGPAGAALAALFVASDRSHPERLGRAGGPIHDALPVAALLDPAIAETVPAAVGIEWAGETAGHTHADFWSVGSSPPNAEVAGGVDAERFLDLLIGRLGHYGARAEPAGELSR